MRTLALSVCGLALAAALSAPAQGAPPERETFTEPFDVVYQCGSFQLPTRTISQVRFDGVITNSATGKTFRDSGHQTVAFRGDGSIVIDGISFMIRSEGAPEAIDVGRVIVDENGDVVFQSARHDLLGENLGDTEAAICAALG
jgi:hypothetical protein